MPHDLRHLAKAARAAGRGFTYAKVVRAGRMFIVPL
jgi:hypothetical protein